MDFNAKIKAILADMKREGPESFAACRAIVERHGLRLLEGGRLADPEGKPILPADVPGWNQN